MGPLLFLCFINDLPSIVDPQTQIRLFADDCLAYRVVSDEEEQHTFQRDIENLTKWGIHWGIEC